MDEEEYILDDDFEQVEELESNSNPRPKRRITRDNDKNIIEEAGRNTKNTGKIIKDSSEQVKNFGENIERMSDAGENVLKATQKGAKVVKQSAKVADKTAEGVRKSGEAMSTAGRATSGVGSGVSSAGAAANAAGAAADATGVGAVAGIPLNVIGTAAQVAGGATQVAGGATQAAGAATQVSGGATQVAAKGIGAGANAAENAAKGAELSNRLGKRFGTTLKNAGNFGKESGKVIEDTGNKLEKTGKELKEMTKPFTGTVTTIKKLPKYLLIATIISAFLGITFYYNQVVSPTSESMERSKNTITGNGGLKEIFSNLFKSKDGTDKVDAKVYEEAKKWYEQSNGQIDLPLVFSALYYPDNNANSFDYSENVEDDDEDASFLEDLFENIKDEYLRGEVRRVRKLCKNMLNSSNRVVSVDEYREYLKKYISKQPEYKKFLDGLTDEQKDKKIEYIINQIYEQRNWYVDVFGDFKTADSEAYSDVCRGAISSSLLPSLGLPVKTSSSINIDGSNAYGITGGSMHNGVDLTSSNSGIRENDDVYSIAPGEIVSIENTQSTNSNSTTMPSGSLNNFLFIGDSRYSGDTSSKIKELGSNVEVDAVVGSTPSQWLYVSSSGSGIVSSSNESKSFTLPTSVSGVSIMLGVNDVSQTEQLKSVLNNLNKKYPNVTIYVNSVYHVGTSYSSTYYTPSKLNEEIDKFNSTMEEFCNNTSWATYIDITTGLYDGSGYNKYQSSDGLHIFDETGMTILVDNIKNAILSGSSKDEAGGTTIKIKHSLLVNDVKYEFYSVLGNLQTDFIKLKVGDAVEKGDVVGKVGKTNSGVTQLHFEFRNQSNTPIDPTNLFVECVSSSGSALVGDTTQEKIWNYFVSSGYNKFQVAAMMGNIEWESGFDTGNLENCVSVISDSDFVSGVDSGKISYQKYLSWPGNGCGYDGGIYGFGLAQWTYPSRKESLYNKVKEKNTSISDLESQVELLKEELDASWLYKNYENIWKTVSSEKGISDATIAYCRGFEIAAGCDNRATAAKNYYNQFKDKEIIYGSPAYDSAKGNQLVEIAMQSIGVPYKPGGTNLSSGVDCSGFMQAVYQKAGISIPRFEQQQAKASNFTIIYDKSSNGTFNDSMVSKLQKGDLLFFQNDDSGVGYGNCYKDIGHVGMYAGNGQYIHAGSPVKLTNVSSSYGNIMQVSRWNGQVTYDENLGNRCRPGLADCACQNESLKWWKK